MTTQPKIEPHVIRHPVLVTRACREARNGHRGVIVWLTGLSGSGKSTLAYSVEE
ncbi:MAG: adenylyl-sulfate kinase, partial [Nitrospira sp.]